MKIAVFLIFLFFVAGCTNNLSATHRAQNQIDYERAQKYYDVGMLSDAEFLFKKILKNSPELDEVALRLGNIYARTNQLEAAVYHYRHCTIKNPANNRCWSNLAVVRVKQAVVTLEEAQKSFAVGSAERENLIRLHDQLVLTLSDS